MPAVPRPNDASLTVARPRLRDLLHFGDGDSDKRVIETAYEQVEHSYYNRSIRN